MNKKLEPVLIVPDTHRPFHDKRAVALMLQAAKDLKPKHIVVLGDYIDFYAVSSHSKNPKRALELDAEVADANVGLDELDALKAKERVYIGGNHEDRLRRYLDDTAPELGDMIKVEKLLKLEERGWQYVPYKSDTQLGKLNLTHDVGSAGRNAVFRSLETYHGSVVIGHTHRMTYIVEGNAKGEVMVSAQFGWLGDAAQADYMHQARARKDWSLGFGVGYLDPETGVVYLTPVPIVNYTCVVNGKFYAG